MLSPWRLESGSPNLTANGVAGSTFGFCFWTGSSSCLLFQPSQPLAALNKTEVSLLATASALPILLQNKDSQPSPDRDLEACQVREHRWKAGLERERGITAANPLY